MKLLLWCAVFVAMVGCGSQQQMEAPSKVPDEAPAAVTPDTTPTAPGLMDLD